MLFVVFGCVSWCEHFCVFPAQYSCLAYKSYIIFLAYDLDVTIHLHQHSSTQLNTSSRYSATTNLDSVLDSSLNSSSTQQVGMTPNSSSVISDVTTTPYQSNENSTSSVTTQAVAVYILAPYILNILFFTISILGIVLNLFTISSITIICLYKPMHKQWTNMFIVNQSINDTFAAFLLFSTVFPYDLRNTPGNVAVEILCRIWFAQMPMYSFLVNSKRFLAVVYPIWHKARFRRKQAAMIILVSWLIGPVISIPFSVSTSGLTANGACSIYYNYASRDLRHLSAVSIFIIVYLFPLVLMFYFYARMIVIFRI